jgi:small subunit ribosomal protein S16
MKKMGRAHRAFFRICAMDQRKPRSGKVLEELGTYDPFVPETDARAILRRDRIDYWLSVGAQPSDKVAVLIKKYGTDGTNIAAQEAALAKMSGPKMVPAAPEPVVKVKTKQELEAEAEEARKAAEAAAEPAPEAEVAADSPAAEAEGGAEEATASE